MKKGRHSHKFHHADLDNAIRALAHRQRGYVKRQQLLAFGMTSELIKWWVATGRLIPVYAGVYAVGHIPTMPIDRAAAAVLACGEGAVLSHASAMCLWGWWKRWDLPFEVTARTARRRDGIRIHRSRTLTRRDVKRHLGIYVTSPARTLMDMAPRLNDRGLRRAVKDALYSKFLRADDLIELLVRNPRHRATGRLRALVGDADNPTRSELEDDWTDFARAAGLTGWRMNVPMGGRILDVLFEKERVIVELDGWDAHSSRISFESDRERDADHLELGYITVRITKQRMHATPAREAQRLHATPAREAQRLHAILAARR